MPRPRKPGSGGARVGTPGKAYPNRSDLTTASQPVRTVPGQPYGQAGAQAAAQKAIPLPTAMGAGAGAAPAAAPAGPPPGPPSPMPGELGPLHSPTDRPDQPVTAGLPTGPGGGPEMLQPPNPLIHGAAVLNALGATADPQTKKLRATINAALQNQGAA